MENKKYFENLDWLRAYAALGVILYHLNFNILSHRVLPYGWIWVDIFFVISWFLITKILLDQVNEKNYFQHFYFRRILRIFPLYFLCLFLTIAYDLLQGLSIDDVYSWFLFIQNWVIWMKWAELEFPRTFWHSWTLAIEQQFYLLWPFFIRYLSVNRLIYVCFGWILLSMVSRFVSYELFWWTMTSYSTLSHLDTLLWGALLGLAYAQSHSPKRIFHWSLSFLAWSAFLYAGSLIFLGIEPFWEKNIVSTDYEWPFFMLILSPICILLVHFLLVNKSWIVRKLFMNPLIVYLWKISYWLYLYHVLVITILYYDSALMRLFRIKTHVFLASVWNLFYHDTKSLVKITYLITSYAAYLFQILIIIALSHFSYKYFEKRFLVHKSRGK